MLVCEARDLGQWECSSAAVALFLCQHCIPHVCRHDRRSTGDRLPLRSAVCDMSVWIPDEETAPDLESTRASEENVVAELRR